MRQAADLAGSAGLTGLLLLSNEALAAALGATSPGIRALLETTGAGHSRPLLLLVYGGFVAPSARLQTPNALRVG